MIVSEAALRLLHWACLANGCAIERPLFSANRQTIHVDTLIMATVRGTALTENKAIELEDRPMTGTPLAYAFDLYGTLVDYTSLGDVFRDVVADPNAFVLHWRQKQLSYAFAATLMDRYADFDTLTGYAFDYSANWHGVANSPALRAKAVAAWSQLPVFADAAETVAGLRERGFKTAVLSNGTPSALARTLANAGLTAQFDAVLSVDAVRAYKPHPSVYRLATDFFETTPERIAFVSSNGWDATGAAEFGFRVLWCNRSNAPAEAFGVPPERIITSLTQLLNA